jgi:uncharacterized protein
MQFAFEFDAAKSRANKGKHGIGLVEAQALWLDGDLLRIAARTEDESRFIVIGMIAGRQWSAVITYRGDTVRIISVRRARAREVQAYESECVRQEVRRGRQRHHGRRRHVDIE